MGDDSDPPKNPFVRWKQHVDTHIIMTLNGLLGIPAMVTKNLNLRKESDDTSGADTAQSNAAGAGAGAADALSAVPPSAPSSPCQPHSAYPSDSSIVPYCVDATQLVEWHKFIYFSPYSPLKLQQLQQLHLLPPPVPQDAPFDADPFSFTYADAFEDLLRASSGRPLLDLSDRSYRNLRYRLRYGSAIERPNSFFHRMNTNRLLDAYFPRAAAVAVGAETTNNADTPLQSTVEAALAKQDRDLWREQRQEEEADKNYGGYEDDDSDETSTQTWSHSMVDSSTNKDSEGQTDRDYGTGSLFDQLDRVFRVLGRVIEDETGAAKADGVKTEAKTETKTDDADAKPAGAGNSQPAVEDELYSMARTAFDSVQSVSSMIKSMTSGFEAEGSLAHTTTSEMWKRSEAAAAATTAGAQGETIQTTEEHVDMFGNRHVKTVVRRLDADGHELSRETRYTIRSPSPENVVMTEVDDGSDEASEKKDAGKNGAGEESPKKPGWFWK